jgi:pleckstrin homology domain-containing family G member 1/2/3
LERGRIKAERRESFISYSRDELFEKENSKKCEHEANCDCESVKQELTDALKQKRSRSETRNPEIEEEVGENVIPMSPLEIKMYTSKTIPKRIEKIKKNREKKETAKFYTDLEDVDASKADNELKIVEPSDDAVKDVQFHRKDSDIIKSILVQSELANRRLQKNSMSRRTSFEQVDQGSPLSRRKLEEALEAIKVESQNASNESQLSTPKKSQDEPLYEELLRNVHVPYKFAPPILKRSLSVSSASSSKDTSLRTPDKVQACSTTTINDDESEFDYVTLTYSDDKLEAVDGVSVNKSNGSSEELKRNSPNTSETNLKPMKSFLHKFMKSPSHEEDIKSVGSRKSLDGSIPNSTWKNMIYKTSTTDIPSVFNTSPHIYRQGSEDLGCRIAHGDYADPKKLFASSTSVNKSSLYKQRDSVVSSSSDSIAQQQQQQQQADPFSDSYYEDTAESVLESKDFRDSAIYSDDSNEKRSDNDHIYATVTKPTPPIKPALPKKPSLLLKPNFTSRPSSTSPNAPVPPPIPSKPSNLKSPEVRNAIFNYRKNNPVQGGEGVENSWVKQQAGKFQ